MTTGQDELSEHVQAFLSSERLAWETELKSLRPRLVAVSSDRDALAARIEQLEGLISAVDGNQDAIVAAVAGSKIQPVPEPVEAAPAAAEVLP